MKHRGHKDQIVSKCHTTEIFGFHQLSKLYSWTFLCKNYILKNDSTSSQSYNTTNKPGKVEGVRCENTAKAPGRFADGGPANCHTIILFINGKIRLSLESTHLHYYHTPHRRSHTPKIHKNFKEIPSIEETLFPDLSHHTNRIQIPIHFSSSYRHNSSHGFECFFIHIRIHILQTSLQRSFRSLCNIT